MVSDDKLTALNAAVAEYGQAKFDEGKAVVPATPVDETPFSQSDMDASFAKGAASVPVASPDGVFTQAEMDKYADSKIAALPADTTPYGEEEMTVLKAEVTAAKELAALLQSDDEADKAKISDLQGKFVKIEAILHPAV